MWESREAVFKEKSPSFLVRFDQELAPEMPRCCKNIFQRS